MWRRDRPDGAVLCRFPGLGDRPTTTLPFELDAERALMRLRCGAVLAVIVDVEARGVAQAERGRRAGIRAIAAFADALHDDALSAEADGDGAEILRDVVDEL